MTVQCFMLHPTDRVWRSLRRYSYPPGDVNRCPGAISYHNAHTLIGVVSGFTRDEDGCWNRDTEMAPPPSTDPRWPLKCEACDYVFTPQDHYQVFDDHIYVTDAGVEHSLRNAPPGAMWYADWMGEWAKGPDGRSLVVVCPNGREWLIDGPASNCTNKGDTGPYGVAHRCWIRHGDPPNITVDKAGRTCAAGGGSIQAGDYHGFLQNGRFT